MPALTPEQVAAKKAAKPAKPEVSVTDDEQVVIEAETPDPSKPFVDKTPAAAPAEPIERAEKPKPASKPVTVAAAAPPTAAKKPVPSLPPELSEKPAIMGYINQYGYGPKQYENLYWTPVERDARDLYHKSRSIGRVPDECFLTALRLWNDPHNRFPLERPELVSLDDLAIGL